jgi:flavin reductase (DIM6/NTAB) family NADH-FMN oxidoreductase RutF
MAKREIKGEVVLFPVPVVLVTCVDKTGKPNIITLAWAGVVCSEPPMVSISIRPHRYSYLLIKEGREFTVNIPTVDIMRQTDICGIVSGRDTDKFNLTKLTPEPAKHVKSPLIKECPVNLECNVKSTMLLGTHEIFLAEVVAVHIDESVMTPAGKIDYAKAKPFSYNWGEYWSLREKIGSYGCSKK